MMRVWALGVAGLGVASLLVAPAARAFCRTTTCDPNKPADGCQFDSQLCVITGKPLSWRSSCVTVGVQQMGSPRNGLSFDDVAPLVEQAFGAWREADCGSGHPSIDVHMLGPIECGVSEYNSDVGNANIVLFREDEWPYVGAANAIGLTTTRFDKDTGALWDADIELNGVGANLTIGDPIEGDDLLSVLTHEAGHFLGLSHSSDPTATMKAVYDPPRDGATFRTLEEDDVAGICAVYPTDRAPTTHSCENRHGFSAQCGADQEPPDEDDKGCNLNARAVGPRASSATLLALLGVVSARLARRRRIV
jgi:hypothetical protein